MSLKPSPSTRFRPSFFAFRAAFSIVCLGVLAVVSRAFGADLEETRKLLLTGHYTECIDSAQKAVAENEYDEEWRWLLGRAQLELGKYPEALATATNAIPRYYSSIRLRLLAWEAFRANGQIDHAKSMLSEINYLAGSRTWAYRDAVNMVTLGRAALLLGGEPRKVLETFYDPIKKQDAKNRDVYIATGDLALNKHDYALASREFQDGLKQNPNDPELLYGLARAFAPSDRQQMMKLIDATLQQNSNHVGCRLLLTDHLIDAEQYDGAKETLQAIFKINPNCPEAWAYEAVLAHLKNDKKTEISDREKALRFWNNNPEVDYLIGKKLSQKYRFTESAEYQKQALRFDPEYLPAKMQLAQDLLRLGKTTDGWILADEVHRADEYDVTAYNLTTLKDVLDKYATITNQNFIVRMPKAEAPVYGDQVLALLERAHTNLCAKYGLELKPPVTVEIFGSQKDFGVRTFGMPDNPGFLGVCFGRVITANSPSAQVSHTANWEAVLWHEFCHVVTLELTRNRMPRWLSEGISVYEERQANPVWGQHMNAQYREMVLSDDLTPVGKLSAAFLNAKSGMHIQFAYYESSMVVEYLVEKYGQPALRKILKDLYDGMAINEAIARNTRPLPEVEKEFKDFIEAKAKALAPGLTWEKPDADKTFNLPIAQQWADSRNYYVLMQKSAELLQEKNWAEAKKPLQILVDKYPTQTGPDSAYYMLAAAHRGLKETDAELAVLTRLAGMDGEAVDAYLRLMEIGVERKDWKLVQLNAERYLAVNPLISQPHWYLGLASEATGDKTEAEDSYRRLLKLDPADPAEVHYRLAKLLYARGAEDARLQVLEALEEAPRFRDAHELLLKIGPGKVNTEKP